MGRKVLVLGLDGGTWSIFDRFIDAGVMPNLQRLCAAGYRAKLMSTIPDITPVAWTSLATGMNPGMHGIYGWSAPHAVLGSYAAPPVRRDLIGKPTLWRRLSEAGLTSMVLCVPLTYPAEAIKGSLVTGMLTPILNSKCTYPPSLKDELLANNCMPRFSMTMKKNMNQGMAGREANPLREALRNDGAQFFEDIDNMTEGLHRTIQYLLKKPWDFFMAVFVGTDRVQHALYDQIVSIGADGTSLLAHRIRDFYSKIDSVIGEIIEAAGNDIVCMLISDHGFGPCVGRYYLGQWLVEAGYARYKPRRLHQFAKRLLAITNTKRLVVRCLSDKSFARITSSSYPFDWSKTRAFFAYVNGIRINLKGREEQGIVKPGPEYEMLRRELRERLLEIKDPVSGKRVISRVWFAEEIYHGTYLQCAPDIVVQGNDEQYYVFQRGVIGNPKLTEQVPYYTGTHRTDGLFLAYGAGVKPDADAAPAHIIDVAPTVMYQLGLPIPDDIEGQVIKEAFAGSPAKRIVEAGTRGGSSVEPPPPSSSAGQYTDEEEEILRRRLRNLGYLD